MKRHGPDATSSFLHLCYIGLLAGTLVVPGVADAQLTMPLTAEQVACNQVQLARMLGRMDVTTGELFGSELPTNLLLSYSNSSGFYEGLVSTGQHREVSGPGGVDFWPERHLSFNLNPSIRTLLLNPSRPTLGQVSLNREQSSSNLVPAGQAWAVSLDVDPSLPGNPNPDRLIINNLELPALEFPYNGFLANSTKPGRGLSEDGLLQSCHDRFTDQDRRIFALLQRILRIEGVLPEVELIASAKISIFREQAEHIYRIEADLLDPVNLIRGHVAAELEIGWTSDGHLTTGSLRVLPLCLEGQTQDCTRVTNYGFVWLLRPVLPGESFWIPSQAVRGSFGPDLPTPDPVAIDFEALLADTTWNP
jgi:hypothetical protein